MSQGRQLFLNFVAVHEFAGCAKVSLLETMLLEKYTRHARPMSIKMYIA